MAIDKQFCGMACVTSDFDYEENSFNTNDADTIESAIVEEGCFCVCKGPESGSMITCDGEGCHVGNNEININNRV